MRPSLIVVLLAGVVLGACREADAPLGNGRLFVDSDPQGGRIFVDNEDTGLVTPDTVTELGSLRDVRVELDSGGVRYRYTARVLVEPNEVTTLTGPLMARCVQVSSSSCSPTVASHTVAGLRFLTSATGALFNGNAGTPGLTWPASSTDGYSVAGTPSFAGTHQGQPAALNPYDQFYLAGRPAPVRVQAGGNLELVQTTWVVPPLEEQGVNAPRGLEVRQYVVASDATPGVVVVELRYRNISTEPLYRILDAGIAAGGTTWQNAYIGLALDPDIGAAADDWVSYDPALDAVYAYDSNFTEGSFTNATAPGLLGLRVLRAPPGTDVVLNTWEALRDWSAATTSQATGYGMLSGTTVFAPDHPGTQVGYLPEAAGDLRIVASAGPLELAPGDSASIVLAIAVAAPQTGTFTPGVATAPGNPDDTGRPLHAVAALLRERLIAAEALLSLLP